MHPVNIKIRLENGATVHGDGMEAKEEIQNEAPESDSEAQI